jgi:cell division septation protein DedD
LASSSAEQDRVHEIQLHGKQLVFLFMSATVVSVVIFLCGVLVGRGVRAERGMGPEAAALAGPQPVDPLPGSAAPVLGSLPSGSDPTAAAPPPNVEEGLSYFNRLEKAGQPEQLKPVGAPREPSSTSTAGEARGEPPRPVAASPRRAIQSEATQAAAPAQPGGFAVQIAALNVRREADAIANRLVTRGYDAYVVAPQGGTPSVFRVRVGTFKTRREAEAVAARLQKEEQFKPWVTR